MFSEAPYLPIVLAIIAFVVIIAWIFLPFAMFGMKDLLRELIGEQRRTNQLLDDRLPALRPTKRETFRTSE